MKKYDRDLMAMNLQFFADEGEGAEGEGVNETETAEQSSTAEVNENDTPDTSETEEVANPQSEVQSKEANAAFASMRRELEAARRQQTEIDAMYAQQYGHLVNPETNKPIRGARDYFEALAAQERMNAREQLQQANVDPDLIDKMIQNSPVIRQAEQATAELNNIRAQQMLEEDFKEVLKLDSSLASSADIVNSDSYQAVCNFVANHPGVRFSEAYKIVNFDRLSSSKTEAAKQAAINQAKSKNHLSTGAALNVNEGMEDIPASMLENFKERFPEKSSKELKALYNKVLNAQKG